MGETPDGLATAFPPGRPDGFFHVTPQLAQRLDLLRHLVQYSDLLLVVAGAPGSGKSTLLAEFLRAAPERWRVCEIVVDAGLGAGDLLALVMAGFGLAHDRDDDDSRVAALERHLETLHRQGLTALITLDDAHLLSPEALGFVTSLAARWEGVKPRLLLLGEPERLTALAHASAPGAGEFVHVLEMPALESEQCLEYIRARLARVPGLAPPATKLLRDVAARSGGNPGEIHRLLAEMVPDTARVADTQRSGLPRTRLLPRARAWLLVVALSLAAGGMTALVVMLLWPATRAPVKAARPVALTAPETARPASTPAAPAAPTPTPVPTTSPAAAPAPVTTRSLAAALPLPQPPPPVQSAAVPPPTTPPSAPAVTTAPGAPAAPATPPAATGAGALPAHETAPQPAPLAALVPVPETQAKAAPKPAPKAREPARQESAKKALASKRPEPNRNPPGRTGGARLHDLAWLRTQPPGNYTLQLMGTTSRKDMLHFARRHHLRGDAAWVRTVREGKDWFVVVYGSYRNLAAAHKALAHLPPALRKASPWPRNIGELVKAGRR